VDLVVDMDPDAVPVVFLNDSTVSSGPRRPGTRQRLRRRARL